MPVQWKGVTEILTGSFCHDAKTGVPLHCYFMNNSNSFISPFVQEPYSTHGYGAIPNQTGIYSTPFNHSTSYNPPVDFFYSASPMWQTLKMGSI